MSCLLVLYSFARASFTSAIHDGLKRFTFQDHDAVAHLAESSMADSDKECRRSMINYQEKGDAIINLDTIILVPGSVAGFQPAVLFVGTLLCFPMTSFASAI